MRFREKLSSKYCKLINAQYWKASTVYLIELFVEAQVVLMKVSRNNKIVCQTVSSLNLLIVGFLGEAVVQRNETGACWTILGIFLRAQKQSDDSRDYLVFTNLAYYSDWINESIKIQDSELNSKTVVE